MAWDNSGESKYSSQKDKGNSRRGIIGIIIGTVLTFIFSAGGALFGRGDSADDPPPGPEQRKETIEMDVLDTDMEVSDPTGFDGSNEFFNYVKSKSNTDKEKFNFAFSCRCSGRGQFRAAGTGIASTQWTAPESGSYELKVNYNANGGYEYGNPGDGVVIASLTSGLHVRKVGAEEPIDIDTRKDTGSSRSDPLEQAMQDAIRFAVGTVTAQRLGPVASAISQEMVSLAENVVGFDIDGESQGAIPLSVSEEQSLSVTFDAEAGDELNLEYTVAATLNGNIDTDGRFSGSVAAEYRPVHFQIRRR